MQGDDDAGDGAGQFDRRLVGHDLGQDLVFLNRIADLDVPADQLGLSRAFAHVGQFEDVVRAGGDRGRSGLSLGRFDGDRSGLRGGDGRGGRFVSGGVAFALDFELGQRAAHGHHLTGLAVQDGDDARNRAGQFDRGLVRHDVGDDLILGDRIADLDVPGDEFGFGGAFAHVGQLEYVTTHISVLRP